MTQIMNKKSGNLSHTAAFRITQAQHEAFASLLATIPGADSGALYREVFRLGLRALQTELRAKAEDLLSGSPENERAL
jgi:hypothetical protein